MGLSPPRRQPIALGEKLLFVRTKQKGQGKAPFPGQGQLIGRSCLEPRVEEGLEVTFAPHGRRVMTGQ